MKQPIFGGQIHIYPESLCSRCIFFRASTKINKYIFQCVEHFQCLPFICPVCSPIWVGETPEMNRNNLFRRFFFCFTLWKTNWWKERVFHLKLVGLIALFTGGQAPILRPKWENWKTRRKFNLIYRSKKKNAGCKNNTKLINQNSLPTRYVE